MGWPDYSHWHSPIGSGSCAMASCCAEFIRCGVNMIRRTKPVCTVGRPSGHTQETGNNTSTIWCPKESTSSIWLKKV